jgi:hypothetical protein
MMKSFQSQQLLLCLVVLCIICVSTKDHKYLSKDLHLRFQLYGRNFSTDEIAHFQSDPEGRGYVTCAGKPHVHDLIRTIYALRITWRSNYPIAIMHCSELDDSFMDTIYTMDVFRNIQFVDICQNATVESVGIEGPAAIKRLRGYFCKAAALVSSPFEHTMMLDLDLVWFKSPDKLWKSTFYTKTGALFFRDRWVIHTESYDKSDPPQPVGIVKTLLKNFELFPHIVLNNSWVQEQYYANGISPFWKALIPYWPAGQSVPKTASFYQDSSIVVVQKSRHQGMMDALKKLMLPFEGFNGDQDIYWIAATVAGEPFTFSPYGGGQYGDCYGFMLHMDPDDALGNTPEWPTPFYINSEYLVEDNEKLTTVGEYLKPTMMKANQIVADKALPNNLNNWAKGHRESKCSSQDYTFLPVPEYVHHHVLYQQWLTLTMRIKRDEQNNLTAALDGKQCLPFLVPTFEKLNALIHDKSIFHPEDCVFLGCPVFPFPTISTPSEVEKWHPSVGRICDPIVYHRPHLFQPSTTQLSPATMEVLHSMASKYRKPIVGINHPHLDKRQAIKCSYLGWDEHYYLLKQVDNQFHEFPNEDTIKVMGFDKWSIPKLTAEVCDKFQFGTPLPKLHLPKKPDNVTKWTRHHR